VSNPIDDDRLFEELAVLAESAGEPVRAPAKLRSRIYTALIREQQRSGPLASVSSPLAAGRKLCVFEQLVQITPVGETTKSRYFCRVCHARLLAERLENPPIWWAHCPYSEFKKS
jgi:hypothetical protein